MTINGISVEEQEKGVSLEPKATKGSIEDLLQTLIEQESKDAVAVGITTNPVPEDVKNFAETQGLKAVIPAGFLLLHNDFQKFFEARNSDNARPSVFDSLSDFFSGAGFASALKTFQSSDFLKSVFEVAGGLTIAAGIVNILSKPLDEDPGVQADKNKEKTENYLGVIEDPEASFGNKFNASIAHTGSAIATGLGAMPKYFDINYDSLKQKWLEEHPGEELGSIQDFSLKLGAFAKGEADTWASFDPEVVKALNALEDPSSDPETYNKLLALRLVKPNAYKNLLDGEITSEDWAALIDWKVDKGSQDYEYLGANIRNIAESLGYGENPTNVQMNEIAGILLNSSDKTIQKMLDIYDIDEGSVLSGKQIAIAQDAVAQSGKSPEELKTILGEAVANTPLTFLTEETLAKQAKALFSESGINKPVEVQAEAKLDDKTTTAINDLVAATGTLMEKVVENTANQNSPFTIPPTINTVAPYKPGYTMNLDLTTSVGNTAGRY